MIVAGSCISPFGIVTMPSELKELLQQREAALFRHIADESDSTKIETLTAEYKIASARILSPFVMFLDSQINSQGSLSAFITRQQKKIESRKRSDTKQENQDNKSAAIAMYSLGSPAQVPVNKGKIPKHDASAWASLRAIHQTGDYDVVEGRDDGITGIRDRMVQALSPDSNKQIFILPIVPENVVKLHQGATLTATLTGTSLCIDEVCDRGPCADYLSYITRRCKVLALPVVTQLVADVPQPRNAFVVRIGDDSFSLVDVDGGTLSAQTLTGHSRPINLQMGIRRNEYNVIIMRFMAVPYHGESASGLSASTLQAPRPFRLVVVTRYDVPRATYVTRYQSRLEALVFPLVGSTDGYLFLYDTYGFPLALWASDIMCDFMAKREDVVTAARAQIGDHFSLLGFDFVATAPMEGMEGVYVIRGTSTSEAAVNIYCLNTCILVVGTPSALPSLVSDYGRTFASQLIADGNLTGYTDSILLFKGSVRSKDYKGDICAFDVVAHQKFLNKKHGNRLQGPAVLVDTFPVKHQTSHVVTKTGCHDVILQVRPHSSTSDTGGWDAAYGPGKTSRGQRSRSFLEKVGKVNASAVTTLFAEMTTFDCQKVCKANTGAAKSSKKHATSLDKLLLCAAALPSSAKTVLLTGWDMLGKCVPTTPETEFMMSQMSHWGVLGGLVPCDPADMGSAHPTGDELETLLVDTVTNFIESCIEQPTVLFSEYCPVLASFCWSFELHSNGNMTVRRGGEIAHLTFDDKPRMVLFKQCDLRDDITTRNNCVYFYPFADPKQLFDQYKVSYNQRREAGSSSDHGTVELMSSSARKMVVAWLDQVPAAQQPPQKKARSSGRSVDGYEMLNSPPPAAAASSSVAPEEEPFPYFTAPLVGRIGMDVEGGRPHLARGESEQQRNQRELERIAGGFDS